jgi:GAF domain-containing protein
MAEHRDSELLMEALSEFAHTLANQFEVSEVLYQLAEHVVAILDVAGTGVSLVDEEDRLRPVTGINELTSLLEAREEQFQEGPCVDAFRDRRIVAVPDLDDVDGSWPRWTVEARLRGVRAVLGVPLRVRDGALGAMNIYSTEPRAWSDSDVRAAQVLSDIAASYVVNASELEHSRRTTEQLREALESRIIIEQAKGMLATELGISIDKAFVVLRDHARRNSASMRSVAHAVVNLGLRPAGKPNVID